MCGATPSQVPFKPPGVQDFMQRPLPDAVWKQLKPAAAQHLDARQFSPDWAQFSYAGFTTTIPSKPCTLRSSPLNGIVTFKVSIVLPAAVAATTINPAATIATFLAPPIGMGLATVSSFSGVDS